MPRREPVAYLRRHGGQLDDGLCYPAAGVAANLLRGRDQLLLGGVGPEHDAVAARPLDRLDHQLVDPIEHFLTFVLEPTTERVDVGQQRLLAEVVLDDRRHVGVDQLVVADSVADRAGDHHVACAGGVEQPRHPEHRVRAELHRIEEVVVDAPVDDVDLTLPFGGAHVDLVVPAEEVTALNQLDPHLPGEKRVLEVRGVVDARSEHDDRRIGLVGGGRLAQRAQQMRRIVTYGANAVGSEQVWENSRHGAAVLHDIGHSRR